MVGSTRCRITRAAQVAGGVVEMTTIILTSNTLQMMGHSMRAGEWGYYWTPDGPEYYSIMYQEARRAKLSHWFPINGRFPAVPASWQGNVYFGVHPTISPGKYWQR